MAMWCRLPGRLETALKMPGLAIASGNHEIYIKSTQLKNKKWPLRSLIIHVFDLFALGYFVLSFPLFSALDWSRECPTRSEAETSESKALYYVYLPLSRTMIIIRSRLQSSPDLPIGSNVNCFYPMNLCRPCHIVLFWGIVCLKK